MPRHLADTPARHVRRALRLLEELEDDLRAPASSVLGRHDHVSLVVAARRRLRLAAVALRSGETARVGFLRKLERLGGIMLKGLVLAALGAAFLLRSAWRFVRGILRFVYGLRAI